MIIIINSLKITLWISAIGCLLAVPFTVLPWNIIESAFLWLDVKPIHDSPITIYLFRIICGVFGLIGIFFAILARNPLQYGYMLNLGAYGLIFFGLLSLILGLNLDVPLKLYIWDALFGLVIGLFVVILSRIKNRVHIKNT